MADNYPVTPGSGRTFASNDIGGVDYPRVKLALGSAGAHDEDLNFKATPYRYLAAAAANQDSAVMKGSPGVLRSFIVWNNTGSAKWLKFYNKATAPTGADTPIFTILVPANNQVVSPYTHGITFTAGISHRMTTGVADADTGACAANDMGLNAGYV